MAKKPIGLKDFKIEMVAIDDLKPYPGNPKAHPETQIAKIANSLKEFGVCKNIVINADNEVLAGHGSILAYKKLGAGGVPCYRAIHMTPAQEKAFRIADNKTAESEWFPESLEAELRALQDMDFDLELTGFDLYELEAMALGGGEAPEDPGPQIDRAAELQEKWGTALGQIWQVGRHQVMCGDALQDLEKLMDGQKADMVFTDPPYGANIVKKLGASIGGAKGHVHGPGGAKPFGYGRVHGPAKKAIIKPGIYAPVIGDETTETAIKAAHLCLSLEIPILIFWGGNYYAEALPSSRCWLVWDKENTGTFADVELAWTNMDRPARLLRHQWSGLMKASERGEARVHPTQKPVALAEWALKFGKENDVVLDLFLGSGFTMVACERLNRRGLGMELSPEYVAVTLERLSQMGLEPKLIKTVEAGITTP